jgi:predicted outer membrane repeat protein
MNPVSYHRRFLFSVSFFVFGFCGIILSSCNRPQEAPHQISCNRDSLINAINSANADPDPTEISLPSGCLIEFENHHNNTGNLGKNALPAITTPITIIGNDSTMQRLSIANRYRFFWISGSGNLRLENLALMFGSIEASGTESNPTGGGGAIYNDGGVLFLRDVYFRNNKGFNGGAIYNTGSMVIEDNTEFSMNHADHHGGAIFTSGEYGLPVTIDDATFTKNGNLETDNGNGGAIYYYSPVPSLLGITDTTFEENKVEGSGGAIYAIGPGTEIHFVDSFAMGNSAKKQGGALFINNGTSKIHNSLFLDNRAWFHHQGYEDLRGGAIYFGDGEHEIYLSRFTDNKATHDGGAIFIDDGTVSISISIIEDGGVNYWEDHVSYGGGIANHGSLTLNQALIKECNSAYGGGLANFGDTVMTNSYLHYNIASSRGGHVYTQGKLDLSFVTMIFGNADHGDSIYVHGADVRVKDSIISTQGDGINCDVHSGSFTAVGENIDPKGECPGFSIQEDPGIDIGGGFFVNLFTLERDSPALGGASDCYDLAGNLLTVDIEGYGRPYPHNESCDIGAVERAFFDEPPPPEPGTFPRLSALKNLTCREGDSEDYPAAGYLLEGESADVIGRNQESTWLVINNPDWEGICWLFRGTVDLDDSLDDVNILIAPQLIREPDYSSSKSGAGTQKCRGDMQKDECERTGGTFNTVSYPNCKCP